VPPPCKDISSQKHFSNKPSFSTRGHQQQIVGNITKAVAFRQMAAKISNPVAFSTNRQREARSKIGSFRLNHGHFEGFKVLIVSGC